MRLYSITNMYMNGIHAGIQTQHSTGELFLKYYEKSNFPQIELVLKWLAEHKTTIVLNGGMHPDLISLLELLNDWEKHDEYEVLPFAPFYEPGVNNALTSISIIMPQDAIDYMDLIRKTKPDTPEYIDLQNSIIISYGRKALEVLEAIAFLPLAK